MATTANQAIPYPSLGDAANGPVAFQNLAQAVEKQLVMSFANTADRTAKLPAPVEGMVAFMRDTDRLEVYNGASWGTGYDPGVDTAWATGTPTWQQAGGTNLVIGNGTIEIRWKLVTAKTVVAHMLMVRGSTTNVGTATYQWTIPAAMPNPRDYRITGSAAIYAASGSIWAGLVQGIGTGTFAISAFAASGTNSRVTTTRPDGAAWASGDSLACDFTYEIP